MGEVMKNEKILKVAIDPGFGDFKVVVNDLMFTFPRAVTETTNAQSYIGDRNKNFYSIKLLDGKEHLVGEFAEKELSERSEQTKRILFDNVESSYERFKSENFKISVMAAIGIGIAKYAVACRKNNIIPAVEVHNGEVDLREWELYVAIALPHEAVDEYRANVVSLIARSEEFSVCTNDGEFKLRVNVKPENFIVMSQARAALIGYVTDDNGKDAINGAELPALVVDGGYRTVGIFKFNENKRVVDSESASNCDYAMYNINSKFVKRLKEYGRISVEEFNVEQKFKALINEGKQMVAINGDGDSVVIPPEEIKKIKAEETLGTFEELVEFLNDKFDQLIDINSIILTGGTGAVYYKMMADYCAKKRAHIQVHLTQYKYRGLEIEPQFAICIGLYKSLNAFIKSKRNAARKQVSTEKNV